MCRVARPSSNLLIGHVTLSVSTDAQWVVRVTPLVETGCTSPSVTAETVEKTPLKSAKVETKDESCWVFSDLGVYRGVNLPGFSP